MTLNRFHSKTASRVVTACTVLVCLATQGHAATDELAILKARYVKTLTDSAPGADKINQTIDSMRPDGAWPDIDYKDKKNNWSHGKHLKRMTQMASAYRDPENECYGSAKVRDALVTALSHWLKKDYQNYNWYKNRITVPKTMANLMVLMGDELPAELKRTIMSKIMPRSKNGMTGQNRVWLAQNNFAKCLTTGNGKELKQARDIILSEIRVTTEEGIQPDWSFHQHGPQQQFGNYGSAFGSTQTQWGELFRGTSYALDNKQLSILRNYLLEGPTWIVWKGQMDFSGCGRQIFADCQSRRGRGILGQLGRMERIDPGHADIYQARIKMNKQGSANTLAGNKLFWRSDMMVHRRPEWYASVKMSSARVIGAETCNGENMLGLHLGDGVLFVYRTAREYENIQPFWDWHRLPGTTCDQSILKLQPGSKQCMLLTTFVGGVSDGANGVAVLDYKRDSLQARKSWFFLDDAIVCLGAGISANKGGTVLTSVQQSLLQGDVVTSAGTLREGKHQLKAATWVHHAGIGYALIAGEKPTMQVAEQKGDWKEIFSQKPADPREGKVFSLWFDHGKAPGKERYAYAMFPQVSADEMAQRMERPGFRVLSNTPDLQAVRTRNSIQAVFYKPGNLRVSSGRHTIAVNKPSVWMLTTSSNGICIYLSDPTQKEKNLDFTIDGTSRSVKLPTGGHAGKSVELKWKIE